MISWQTPESSRQRRESQNTGSSIHGTHVLLESNLARLKGVAPIELDQAYGVVGLTEDKLARHVAESVVGRLARPSRMPGSACARRPWHSRQKVLPSDDQKHQLASWLRRHPRRHRGVAQHRAPDGGAQCQCVDDGQLLGDRPSHRRSGATRQASRGIR